MGILFEPSEIFRIATEIEGNGIKFYREYAKKTDDTEIKNVFLYLAEEEVIHKNLFSEMLSKMEKQEFPETYPGEYLEYLKNYVEGIIFNKEKIENELSLVKDSLSAVDFAINRELESILYYTEIKNLVVRGRDKIDKIIEEERRHFLKLSEIKKELLKK